MPLRIRVSTKAATFQERKEQHIQRGYRIEDERPAPVNGLCSFVAVKDDAVLDSFEWLTSNSSKVFQTD
jgi:hypothetical protein